MSLNLPSCVLKEMSHAMPRQLTSNRTSIGGGISVRETRDAAIRRTRLHNERLAEAQISSIRKGAEIDGAISGQSHFSHA